MRSATKKISTRNILKSTAITLALTFSFCFSIAQDRSETPNGHANLDTLKSASQTIYFSSGRGERAKNISIFMNGAVGFFQKEIGFTPKTKLYILSPQDWKEFAAPPLKNVYGFPHNIDSGQLIMASDDNDFWASYLPDIGKLPIDLVAKVSTAYRKPDSTYSMMPFFDLLALHELGHSYTSQAGLKMHRHWMAELFVNIMLHTYVAEKQPQLLPALEAFPGMVIAAGTKEYLFTSLTDFERLYSTLGMGAKNYGWYQCRLHTAAKEIYDKGGSGVLKRLWSALKKHQDVMSDKDFVQMLSEEVDTSVAEVYLKW